MAAHMDDSVVSELDEFLAEEDDAAHQQLQQQQEGAGAAAAAAANSPQGPGQLPQQALQNLQRILQSQLANVNPIHLQQALQRHQQQQMVDAGRKQLEQMLQQLQVSSKLVEIIRFT